MSGRPMTMLFATLLMGALAAGSIALAARQGSLEEGVRSTWQMTREIIPILIFAIILAGMAQVVIPQAMLARWLGEEAGMRGIFVGAAAGGLCPGGPYVSFPLVLALANAGASIPTLVAFLTSWSLWAVSRLPIEVGFLGWRFVIIRLLSVLLLPLAAGFLAQMWMRFFR